MSQKLCFLAALAAILVLVCGTPARGGKPPKLSYQVIQLDLVDQDGVAYAYSQANDVSSPSQGPRQVVGSVEPTSDQHFPACWTTRVVDGTVQSELHVLALPTANGMAAGINQYGEIVGVGSDDGQLVGLYWSQYGAEPDVLDPLDGHTGSYAFAINKDGVVCGVSQLAVPRVDESGNPVLDDLDDPVMDYEYRAVVWLRNDNGVFDPFELCTSGVFFSTAINDNDADVVKVVGATSPDAGASGASSAVAWTVLLQAGQPVEVYTVTLDAVGRAEGVNKAGTVCGAAETSNPLLQAVVWTGGTKLALKGARFYITRAANDINDEGVIVGWSEYTKNLSGSSHAVMWSSATGSMVLLNQFLDDNSPLTTLSWANAVNNYDEIVGFGYAGPRHRAFLAIPK